MQEASIGIVRHPDDPSQILWVKRRDLPIWVLPGGGIDPGESAESAVIREILEESGIIAAIERKAAIYRPINCLSATTHLYLCQKAEGEESPQKESALVGYFPIKSPPTPHFPLHDIWVQEIFAHPDTYIDRPIHELTWENLGGFFLRHPVIFLNYLLRRGWNFAFRRP